MRDALDTVVNILSDSEYVFADVESVLQAEGPALVLITGKKGVHVGTGDEFLHVSLLLLLIAILVAVECVYLKHDHNRELGMILT